MQTRKEYRALLVPKSLNANETFITVTIGDKKYYYKTGETKALAAN